MWFYSRGSGGVRVTEAQSRGWGPGLGEGRGCPCFMGAESQFGKMRKFWRRTVVTAAQQ